MHLLFQILLSNLCIASQQQDYVVNHSKLPWKKDATKILDSFAGIIDTSADKSFFFWYFDHPDPSSPLIIWLQGGPGSSSMIGLFNENGPFNIANDGSLTNNPYSWTRDCAMLFIGLYRCNPDNPVGTGFSKVKKNGVIDRALVFENNGRSQEQLIVESVMEDQTLRRRYSFKSTESDLLGTPEYNQSYVMNQAAVSQDLHRFLREWYAVFFEAKNRPLYVSGESYAGKYVPGFATWLAQYDPSIPLKGIMIGNGFTDPASMVLTHSQQAYAMGLVSTKQAEQMHQLAVESHQLASRHEYLKSLDYRLKMFDYFKKVTGDLNWYNLIKYGGNNWTLTNRFMNKHKKTLNVGDDRVFEKDPLVFSNLVGDIMKSYAHLFPYLLDQAKIKVLLYQGNLDFRDGVLASTEWIESIPWSGAAGFAAAERVPVVQGWTRTFSRLRWDVIHAAGHLVPLDQGEAALKMITDWLKN